MEDTAEKDESKSKPQPAKLKQNKKKKVAVDYDELEDEEDEDNNNQESKYSSKKEKNKSKAVDEEYKQMKINNQVSSLIAFLDKAIEKDNENANNNQPSLEKLRSLPYLDKILHKESFSNEFLQKNGLNYLQEFLKRSQDGSFPCINQIQKILSILDDLPITKEQLEESKINSFILDIKKNLKECKKTQTKARLLYDKWMRVISGLENTQNNIDNENEHYSRLFLKKKRGTDNSNMDNELYRNYYEKLSEKKVIPQKALYDFIVNPDPKEINIKEEERIAKKNFFLPSKKPGIVQKKNNKDIQLEFDDFYNEN